MHGAALFPGMSRRTRHSTAFAALVAVGVFLLIFLSGRTPGNSSANSNASESVNGSSSGSVGVGASGDDSSGAQGPPSPRAPPSSPLLHPPSSAAPDPPHSGVRVVLYDTYGRPVVGEGYTVPRVRACVGDTVLVIWKGINNDVVETETKDCTSQVLRFVESEKRSPPYNATFGDLSAMPGTTRYFSSTLHCGSRGARFEVFC